MGPGERCPKKCSVANVIQLDLARALCLQLGIGRDQLGILEGSWYLLTSYNCTYNPTYNTPKGPYRGYPNYK